MLVAFSWNVAELTTIVFRRQKKRGIHPGVAVAAELIIWCGMLASIALLARNVSYGAWWAYDDSFTYHENVEIALLTMVILLL